MTIFEYVMILLSVVISLGLAKLLETHAHLLKHGKGVKWSATYVGWLLMLLFAQIDIWASLWQVHANGRWTALEIGLSLLAAASLFYATIFATPETTAEEVDLWAFHLANRRRYATALLLYCVIGGVLNASLMRETFSTANITTLGPSIIILGLAIVFDNRWVQRLAIASMLALILVYFAQYMPAIGN